LDKREEEIIKSAMEVFAEVGFHKAKISHIADRAGIAVGTIYLYFKKKEDILEAILMRSWSIVETALKLVISDSDLKGTEKIKELISIIVNQAKQNRLMAQIILHEFKFWSDNDNIKLKPLITSIQSLLRKIISEGMENEFRSDIDPGAVTSFFIGGVWHYLAYYSSNLETVNEYTIKRALEKLVLQGLLK